VRNLLDLDYPRLEVIVVNDGQKIDFGRDAGGVPSAAGPGGVRPEAKSAPVRGLYRSEVEARLVVVDKEPGGSKGRCRDAGLNAATSPYVCVVDADSILEHDALLRIMVPILEDPKRVARWAESSVYERIGGRRRTLAARASAAQEH